MANENDVNWMVPLRRAVVKKPLKYNEFLQLWVDKQLRNADSMRVMRSWYGTSDPKGKDLKISDYIRAIHALQHWLAVTFEASTTVATNPVGVTTLQTYVPNFHARLWKGPKRVLLELRANEDPEKLAEIQPFELEGGRIKPQLDDEGKPKPIQLLPGDVLEVPVHEFLSACGQNQFEDIEFDPVGSFYLGTTVRSKSGRARIKLPRLHDNMLAMRFQLVTALNMANCYHDEPVYSAEYTGSIHRRQIKPEGAGLFARGMPFGGNSSSTIVSGPLRWKLYQPNTNQPDVERPIYLPPKLDLSHYTEKLPLSWGWTCTPFVLFFVTMLSDAHQDQNGIVYPNNFRQGSLAASLCLSTDPNANKNVYELVVEFQAKNEKSDLLLHGLDPSHTQSPREQPPMADLWEVVFPADRGNPGGRPFTDPNNDRIKKLALPDPGKVETSNWDTVCPDASVIVVSSTEGHEFALVRLYQADKIMADAVGALSKGGDAKLPTAGRLSAYNPLNGEDYCEHESMEGGLFFTTESSATMPPKNRARYSNLMISGVKIHKFRPTPANEVKFQMYEPTKKEKKGGAVPELRIDDTGGKFRTKRVSAIFYLREGGPHDPDPRTLWRIYEIPRESWLPASLNFSSKAGTAEAKKLLANIDKLYGERAVPFPAILEVVSGLPSRERVHEQLDNHHRRLVELGKADAETKVKAEIAAETNSELRKRLETDLKLIATYTEEDFKGDEMSEEEKAKIGTRKWEALRLALIALVSGNQGAGDDLE